MRLAKLFVLVIALALIPQLALAAKGDKTFRFGLDWVDPTGDLSIPPSSPALLAAIGYVIEADSAVGPEVGFEYMFTDMVGFDVNLGLFNHDIEESSAFFSGTIGEVEVMPLLVGANFHLMREKKADFYIGPTVGYIMFGDLEEEFGSGEVPLKDDFGYGLNLGVDVPFSDKWSFSAGLKYLVYGAEVDFPGAPTVDIDPLVLRVGAAFDF